MGYVRVGLVQEGIRTIICTFRVSTCWRYLYRAKKNGKNITSLVWKPSHIYFIVFSIFCYNSNRNILSVKISTV